MSYETIWAELEAAPTPTTTGRLQRRIKPEASCDIFLGVRRPANQRMLLVEVAALELEGVAEIPSARGIQARILRRPTDDIDGVEVALADARYADIFDALVADIASSVARAPSGAAAVAQLVTQLRRWQRFLQVGARGLGEEAQRGLYAELWFMRARLLKRLGPTVTVRSWKGPQAAHQDFQMSDLAIEVKATSGKQPQSLRITSERQLDDTGIGVLVLFHLSLDVREGSGETLPGIVRELRAQLANDLVASELFEDLLFQAGYADLHQDLYRQSGYAVRVANTFRLRDGFPRLTERDLPIGVGDVQYSISVASCAQFAMSDSEFLAMLDQVVS